MTLRRAASELYWTATVSGGVIPFYKNATPLELVVLGDIGGIGKLTGENASLQCKRRCNAKDVAVLRLYSRSVQRNRKRGDMVIGNLQRFAMNLMVPHVETLHCNVFSIQRDAFAMQRIVIRKKVTGEMTSLGSYELLFCRTLIHKPCA